MSRWVGDSQVTLGAGSPRASQAAETRPRRSTWMTEIVLLRMATARSTTLTRTRISSLPAWFSAKHVSFLPRAHLVEVGVPL